MDIKYKNCIKLRNKDSFIKLYFKFNGAKMDGGEE